MPTSYIDSLLLNLYHYVFFSIVTDLAGSIGTGYLLAIFTGHFHGPLELSTVARKSRRRMVMLECGLHLAGADCDVDVVVDDVQVASG